MKTFRELKLNKDIITSLDEMGFSEATPIQEKVIPFLLENSQDIIALAQTGTGKTAAFGLPIVDKIKSDNDNQAKKKIKAIILCPTRELCLQVADDIKNYSKHSSKTSVLAVYGGEKIEFQIRNLKTGVDIVVGTPGRVHDLIRRKFLDLSAIKFLVLDEADEMLDMGFKEDLDAILEKTPQERQTLLFSATISKSVLNISKKYLKNAKEIKVEGTSVGAENVSHKYFVCAPRDRFEALQRVLDSLYGVYGILFCRTKRETQEVCEKLRQQNYNAEAIHGDIAQNMRTKIMKRFKDKQINLLVATDVAARGIDVDNLSHVINYNLPDNDEAYIHRTGRTGRANNSGVSISILSPGDTRKLKHLEHITGKKIAYEKIPSVNSIEEKRLQSFLETIKVIDEETLKKNKKYQAYLEKLESVDKKDLLNYIIKEQLESQASDSINNRDLNVDMTKPFKRNSNFKKSSFNRGGSNSNRSRFKGGSRGNRRAKGNFQSRSNRNKK
ncbi:DEAD/DEAH box helicase [Patescibacteria group bacterium]|nr:DEAD/DEAH box helicase [Patescibacteria group bacterium]